MDKSVKVGYVILHYQTWKETCDCVESIKKIKDKTDVILIIDNCSPNNSGEMLQEKYKDEEDIVTFRNPENAGFAKGNNIGFRLAKYEYGCDFIILLNNDTLILQENFRQRMIEAYNQYHYAVMGPKILQKDGTVNKTSPSQPIHTNLFRARIGQCSNYIRYILSVFGLDIWLGRLIDKPSESVNYIDEYQENVQISGCCMIFSQEYISKFEGLNENTFMYLEEILLYIRVRNSALKIIYNPELEIIHLEDAATLDVFEGKTKRARRFKYRCQMLSFKVLIDELKSK